MNHGLIEGVEVQFVKFDQDLYDHVIRSRRIEDEGAKAKIKEAVRYNVFSRVMLSDMTGIPVSTIAFRMKPKFDEQGNVVTELDYTFPFPSLGKNGFQFIVRNEKSLRLLRK